MNSSIRPIEESKKTIAAVVEERIRSAILSGELKPGSRLDQTRLAAGLNVSLVPVREALKKLEGDGFVRIIPRRGAFVTQTSIRDMEDLYFVRKILEGEAAFHAAPHIDAARLARLEDHIWAMDVALAAQDFSEFLAVNREFHFTIYEASGSDYLMNAVAAHWQLAERYRFHYMLLYVRDSGPSSQAEHRVILQACRERAPDALRAAIVQHMNRTLEGLRRYLPKQTGRQTGRKSET